MFTLVSLQMPILLFSFILVIAKVNIKLPAEIENQPLRAKLRRIDGFGSLTLVGTVGCLLLGLSLKSTEELDWSHPVVWGLLLASAVFCALFIMVESWLAPYPVMPMRLVTQRTPLAVSLSNFFGSMAAFSMVCSSTSFYPPTTESDCRIFCSSCTIFHWSVTITHASGWSFEPVQSLINPYSIFPRSDSTRQQVQVRSRPFHQRINEVLTAKTPGMHLLPHSVCLFCRLACLLRMQVLTLRVSRSLSQLEACLPAGAFSSRNLL